VRQIRVVVADDHELVRRGVSALIERCPGWRVCDEAQDGREAVEKTLRLKPDVLVLDLHMPDLNGLEAARQILHQNPEQKILVLTIADSEPTIHELLKIGVKGYLLKSDAGTELVTAIEALASNRVFFNSAIEQMVVDGFLNGRKSSGENDSPLLLTAREREVLQLLAEGKATKDVASTLNLSVKTAETHRSNIMRKLDLHTISEVVLYAVRHGIVHVPNYGVGKDDESSAAAGS
jgi:DNA-binding NarL/FixJ family response regulator